MTTTTTAPAPAPAPAPATVTPESIRGLYEAASDLYMAVSARGTVPRDLAGTWHNVRAFMHRLPGQAYHQEGAGEPPTPEQVAAFHEALCRHGRRLWSALAAAR